MLVYKATKADMTCTMGDGNFQYKLNVPAHADSTKCGRRGLHACEYVLDCFRYYSLMIGSLRQRQKAPSMRTERTRGSRANS